MEPVTCDECGEPLPDDPAIIEFGRHPVCDQIAIARGVHQLEASGFVWEPPMHCAICGAVIETAELCAACAKGNDPFFTSKYKGDHGP